MIDIHAHILWGLDDGPVEVSASLEMARRLVALGYQKVLCAAHINTAHFENNTAIISERCQEFERELRQADIPLTPHPFAEVRLDELTCPRLDEGLIPTFKNHMLAEGPFGNWPDFLDKIIHQIQSRKIKPIIAHVERNGFLQNNLAKIKQLKENGCQIQVNLLSILGSYGEIAQHCVVGLLNEDIVDYIATDMHRPIADADAYQRAQNVYINIIGDAKFRELSGARLT